MGKFDVGSETNCLKKRNEIASKTVILLATYMYKYVELV